MPASTFLSRLPPAFSASHRRQSSPDLLVPPSILSRTPRAAVRQDLPYPAAQAPGQGAGPREREGGRRRW
eukprot:2246012-Rhodomonas_salina.1